MKFTSLSSIPLSIALLIGNMTIANGQETNDRELQEFCQKFPYNQKCDDVSLDDTDEFCLNYPQDRQCEKRKNLISLEERQGETFYCRLTPTQAKKSKNCKILVKDETIIAYLEEGEAIKELDNQENTQEIIINIEDVFDFNSQWWLADVGNEEESVGMFADIQIGYLLKNSQGDNKSKFLTISANKDGDKGFSNENIPKLLEQLEPWLYHNPDLTAIARQLNLENSSDTQVADNIQLLLDTKECPRCNLKGADLSNANLERAYLVGANLSNANLHQANFENSIMFLASLENSNLSNANLQATNLQYSNLNNADLTQANLDGNGLNVTQLQNAKLINTNLTEANLKCANLDSANLRNANLTQANLEKCEPKTSIYKVNISNFLLNNAKISTPLGDVGDALKYITTIISIISNPNDTIDTSGLNTVGLRGVKFIGKTNLNNANLSGANLTETILDGADLFNSNLNNATLDYTDLRDTDLSNSNLIDAKISNSDLEEAFLCNTIMPDVSIVQQGCLEDEEVTEEDEDK